MVDEQEGALRRNRTRENGPIRGVNMARKEDRLEESEKMGD